MYKKNFKDQIEELFSESNSNYTLTINSHNNYNIPTKYEKYSYF